MNTTQAHSQRLLQTVLCAVAAALLTACGGGSSQVALPDSETLKSACPTLAGQTITASAIGLPSGKATVTKATFVAAVPQAVNGSTTTPATPDYCMVLGTIAPVDPAAQLINFQVNLPTAWNRKAVQYGGGGYNGSLVTGLVSCRRNSLH